MNALQMHTGRTLMKGRKSFRLHFVGTAVFASAMVVTALSGTSSASTTAQTKSHVPAHAATVKPDYAFYKGKTIHWLTPGAPGSTQDVVFRAMQPYLENKLGVTIVQQIIPGNQIISADELANAAPDGLTIGTQGVGSALYNELTNVTPESFSLQKVTYFASGKNAPYILVSCAGSGITSLQQLINDKQQVTYLDFPNTSDVIYHTLLAAYHVNVKYLTGYTAPTLQAGCIRGDGTITGAGATNVGATSSLPPGETLLAMTTKAGPGTPTRWMNTDPSSTLISTFVKKHPIKDTAARRAVNVVLDISQYAPNTTFWGPQGISPGKTAALTAVIEKGLATPGVEAAFLSQNIPTGFIPPTTILSAIKEEVNHFPSLRRFVLGVGLP